MKTIWDLVVMLGGLALPGMAMAQAATAAAAAPAAPVTLSIPSQALDTALNEFAQQTGLQVIFRADEVGAKLTSKPLSGKYEAEEALRLLLADSGLQYKYLNDRTIAVRPKEKRATAVETANTDGIRLAQAEQSGAAAEGVSSADRLEEVNPTLEKIPEVLVQGSRTLNMDIKRTRDDVQPYVVFGREDIDRSGARNIGDFLAERLSAATDTSQVAQSNSGANTSSFNLRGLQSEQTLVLIDGHRAANTAGQLSQPDINSIPLAAIDRIEVLPATASGIYGGGATGGVINVILRHDYEGVAANVAYQNSFDGGGATRRVELTSGLNLGSRTNLMVVAAYSDGTPLLRGDRHFLQRAFARIVANTPGSVLPGFAPPLGATSNICSATEFVPGFPQAGAACDGAPLVLDGGSAVGASFTSVPEGYAGVASDDGAGLIQRAGQYNFGLADTAQDYGLAGRAALWTDPTVKSFKATLRRELTPWMQVFVDAGWSSNGGSFSYSQVNSSFTLAANAPNNPFDHTVLVTTPAFGTDDPSTSRLTDKRAVVGAIFKLPKDWSAEVDYTWDRARVETFAEGGAITPGAADAVANGITATGAPFDAFSSQRLDFSSFLYDPFQVTPARSTLKDATMRFAGPYLHNLLPGGSPSLTVLAEHRDEGYGEQSNFYPAYSVGVIDYAKSLKADSLYVETNLPVFGEQNHIAGVQSLEVQLAARHERYGLHAANSTTFIPGVLDPEPRVLSKRSFESTDPTIGLRYQPLADLTLRASYGTGFVAPPMYLLNAGALLPTDGATQGGLTDPLRGNEPIGTFLTNPFATNPDLKPEHSKSRSMGFILTPRVAPGLRLSVDWTRINKKDNVAGLLLDQSFINNERFYPGFIVRGPASGGFDVGPITQITTTTLNIGRQKFAFLDLALDYRLETAAAGTFSFSAQATHNREFASRVTPDAPVQDLIGLAAGIRWRGRAAIDWDYHNWNVEWAARYFDSYCLNVSCDPGFNTEQQGSLKVPSQTYHDVSVRYAFGVTAPRQMLSNLEIQLGVKNVFNHVPPVDLTFYPYYSTFGDPRLASYFLSLRKSFAAR